MKDYFSTTPSPEMNIILNSIREGVNRILSVCVEYKGVAFIDVGANVIQAFVLHRDRTLESISIDRSIWGGKADPYKTGALSLSDSINRILACWNKCSTPSYIKLMNTRDSELEKYGSD